MAPGIGLPFIDHWYRRPELLAATKKVALAPSRAVTSAGCCVITGAPSRMMSTARLTTEPTLLEIVTVYVPTSASATFRKSNTGKVAPWKLSAVLRPLIGQRAAAGGTDRDDARPAEGDDERGRLRGDGGSGSAWLLR